MASNLIEKIKEHNILDVVSEHVALKKKGNSWLGLCPFHNEKTPSFNVHEQKGIYKCFGCGETGDSISFIEKQLGITTKEAIDLLAKKFNIIENKKNMQTYYFEKDIVQKSQIHGDRSVLGQWLINTFYADGFDVCQKYGIGLSKKWSGAVIFWRIDQFNRIRTGKIMAYYLNGDDCKRVKEPFNYVSWVHDKMELPNNHEIKQCLFGLHLLDESNPIMLVESEKTAMFGACKQPEYTWMATGGSANFTAKMLAPLAGREVTIIPDKGTEETWLSKYSSFDFLFKAKWQFIDDKYPKGYDFVDVCLQK